MSSLSQALKALHSLFPQAAAARGAGMALCLAAGLGFGQLAPAQAQSRFSIDEARQLSGDMLQTGRPVEARALALGLLKADPKDVAALIILSQAERTLGRHEVARDAGAAAWTYAVTDAQHYAAAVVTAQALVADKKLSRAQLWLRRAAQHAPNAAAGQMVAQDFGRLRQANPLSLTFGAKVSPSSNVNNGSSNETTTFEGIPFVFTLSPEARALSGVEASLTFGLKYRLAAKGRQVTSANFELFTREIAFSRDAQRAAPDAEAGNYAFSQASAGLTHSWYSKDNKRAWTLGGALGQSWYGGAAYTRNAQLFVTHNLTFGAGKSLALTLSGENTGFVGTSRHNQTYQLRGSWNQMQKDGRRLTLSFGLGQTQSRQTTSENTKVSLGARYGLGEVLDGIDLTLDYRIEFQHYPVAGLTSGSRQDVRNSLSAEFGFRKAAFYGFEPVVAVEASQNRSSVDFYNNASLKLGLNLRSSF